MKCLKNLNNDQSLGVVENCIFYELNHFHVTKNLSVDPMHDVLEGICRYDLGKLLHYFIYVKKYFSLEYINKKIQSFDFGDNDSCNNATEIIESQIKKKFIIMSSAEMLNFVRN